MKDIAEPIPMFELERARLSRRIGAIVGTPVVKELSNYRRDINKLPAIGRRGVRAFPIKTVRGMRYRAFDEIKLCHAFLDARDVPPMHT